MRYWQTAVIGAAVPGVSSSPKRASCIAQTSYKIMDPADESSSNASRDPIQVALEWKDRGNAHYGQREFEQAAKAYQAGLDALPQHMLTTPSTRSSDMEDDDLPVALRSNLALTLIKLEEFDRAEGECSAVLETFGPHAKGEY